MSNKMNTQQTYRVYKDALNNTKAEVFRHGTPEPEDVILRVYLPAEPFMCLFLMTNMSHEEAVRLAKFPKDLEDAVIEETNRAGLQDAHEAFYMLIFNLHPQLAKKYEKRIAAQLGEALDKLGGWLNPIVLRNGIAYRYDCVVNTKQVDVTREAITAVLKKHGIKVFTFEPNDF